EAERSTTSTSPAATVPVGTSGLAPPSTPSAGATGAVDGPCVDVLPGAPGACAGAVGLCVDGVLPVAATTVKSELPRNVKGSTPSRSPSGPYFTALARKRSQCLPLPRSAGTRKLPCTA